MLLHQHKLKMKTRGQASIEMIFVVGMLFFVLLTILAFVFNKRIEINQQNRVVETKSDCIKLSNLIVNAFLSGNNTRIESTMNFDFFVDMESRVVTVDDFVTCTIPLNQTQDAALDKGNITVENKNNIVVVSNA